MLTETLQRLERLDRMDSTLFGRELLSFGRLLLDRGWIAAIGYFSHIDVEVMDDIFEEVEVTVHRNQQADKHLALMRQQHMGTGAMRQRIRQMAQHLICQGLATAHRILRIHIEQRHQRLPV